MAVNLSWLAAVTALCGAAAVLGAAPAAADQIETVSAGFAGDAALIPSFDTSLGTLDEVSVSISGVLTLTLATTPNLQSNGEAPVPTPYPISGQAMLEFQGAAFNSQPPGELFPVNALADGAGGPATAVVPIDTGFTFNASTDVVGFAVDPSTPDGVFFGTRANFAPGPFSVPLVEADVPTYQDLSQLPDFLITWDLAGAVVVQYTYTPATAPAVPEPANLTLLGMGLAALAMVRRAAKARSRGGPPPS